MAAYPQAVRDHPPPPPPITITDPSRPSAPIELLEPPAQRPRPSRRGTAGAAVIALVAAASVVVVHLWNTHEQHLAAQRRLVSVQLTAMIEGTDEAFDPDLMHGAWGTLVSIRSGPAQEFRVLAVTLDEGAWKVDPAGLPQVASTSNLIAVRFAGTCAQVERLVTPTQLRVSGRRPGGPVISRTIDFDGSSMIESPRRSCGLGDFASFLDISLVGSRGREPFVTVDVSLLNRSRQVGQITALSITSTQVTTRPKLPVVVPPSVANQPGPLVQLQLMVRYLCRLPAGQDTALNLDLIDGAGNPVHVVVGQDESTGQLLDQLARETCRR